MKFEAYADNDDDEYVVGVGGHDNNGGGGGGDDDDNNDNFSALAQMKFEVYAGVQTHHPFFRYIIHQN